MEYLAMRWGRGNHWEQAPLHFAAAHGVFWDSLLSTLAIIRDLVKDAINGEEPPLGGIYAASLFGRSPCAAKTLLAAGVLT